jgi:uncharacterized protein (DUF4415 family)
MASTSMYPSALPRIDDNHYPEIRIIALGFLGVRLHVICFTLIDDGVRIISFRKQTDGRYDIMNMKPIIDKSGEVSELDREDMNRFRTATELFPKELLAVLPKRKPGQRGVQKMLQKKSLTVRYSRNVLEYFRSTGPRGQARIDAALKQWVAQHGQGSERKGH